MAHLHIFSIRVVGRAADETAARQDLARRLKRSGIEIDSGLELVEVRDEEEEWKLVAVVETKPKEQMKIVFEQLPTNLRTYYFKRRQDIREIVQEGDIFTFHFNYNQIDIWTFSQTKGWDRRVVMTK